MITGNLKINSEKLHIIANNCYEAINISQSKEEALKKISDIAFNEIGEFFGPYILENPDQLSINFIELLDQILYSVYDIESDNETIRSYVVEDLYLRIQIYLDIFKNRDAYIKSLSGRMLSYDDTIIINQMEIVELIPDLMAEFYEQPNLQKAIIRCLIKFDVEELLNFYYQIVKDIFCLELKTLALLGLKTLSSNFNNWHLLKHIDDELTIIVGYCEKFNTDKLENNDQPGDLYSMLFTVNFIELNISRFRNDKSIQWVFRLNQNLLEMNMENSLFTGISQSLSKIILSLDLNHLKTFLKENDNLISFINVIDILPGSYFNRIIGKLNLLGNEFIESIQFLISSKKISLKSNDSNISNFIIWTSSYKLRLV